MAARVSRSLRFGLAASSLLAASACARSRPSPRVAAPPAVDPSLAWKAHAVPRRFGPGADAPAGCFAWSASRASAACVLGQWPYRRASVPRVVSFLAASGDEPIPLPLQLESEDRALAREPRIAVLSRNRLDVAMRDGAFVELPAAITISSNAPPRAVGPFTVAMRHASLDVRLARTGPSLLTDADGTTQCPDPGSRVFQVSPSLLVVERVCRLAASRGRDVVVTAWVCDGAKGVCR